MKQSLRIACCVAVIAATLSAALACSSSDPDGPISTAEVQVAGLITEMQMQGDKLISISIRELSTDETKTFPIRDPANLGVDVAHLREHQDTKLKVTLVLSDDRGRLVVDRIDD